MTVTFLRVAERETAAATKYYTGIDPDLGERFRLEIQRILLGLRTQPLLHATRRGGFRRINLDDFPYDVAYVIRAENVRVVAVAHASRQPVYFYRRLS